MKKLQKGKDLIKKLGLMPPNELDIKALASYFDHQKTSDIQGTDAVTQGRGCLAISGDLDTADVILIGKGMVFDSGGANIKHSHMEEMKFDMLGAATILGVKEVLPKKAKVAYIGCVADNYFGDGMIYPSFVIEYADKTKVEIINTDAEGRLVLADGIIEAKKHKPKLIITVATLTGSAAAALGPATALFSNSQVHANKFLKASKELVWQMPIFDVHKENIKSLPEVADIKNCGSMAGASTAAAFLDHFMGDTKYIHLDIAGSAYKSGIPTGAMLDSLVRFLK